VGGGWDAGKQRFYGFVATSPQLKKIAGEPGVPLCHPSPTVTRGDPPPSRYATAVFITTIKLAHTAQSRDQFITVENNCMRTVQI